MNSKLLILLLLGFSVLFFGCASRQDSDDGDLQDVLGPGNGTPRDNVVPSPDDGSNESDEGNMIPPADEIPGEEDSIGETPPSGNETENEPTSENETGDDELEPTDAEEEKLADLFRIDTEKPIGDEGLDSEGPSSKSN
jgi:hypothetical protein